MSAALAADALVLEGYHTEWRLVSEHRSNVLLEGTVAATDAVLRLLRPHIGEPIVWKPPATLDLASDETRVLILMDAAALTSDDQRSLLAWMDDAGSRRRVITTALRPLFTLVTAGLFDAALYYRLNVLLLRLGRTDGVR